MLLMTHGFKLV